MHAWCFKTLHTMNLHTAMHCVDVLYLCTYMYRVCASMLNKPNTCQDETCKLENISAYQKL